MNMHPVPRHSHSRLTNPEVLEAFEFAAQADAPDAQRAYLADWKHFLAWCKNRNRCPLPVGPDDLALYLPFRGEAWAKDFNGAAAGVGYLRGSCSQRPSVAGRRMGCAKHHEAASTRSRCPGPREEPGVG